MTGRMIEQLGGEASVAKRFASATKPDLNAAFDLLPQSPQNTRNKYALEAAVARGHVTVAQLASLPDEQVIKKVHNLGEKGIPLLNEALEIILNTSK